VKRRYYFRIRTNAVLYFAPLVLALFLVSCRAKSKEEVFGEYQSLGGKMDAKLYLKRDMKYEQLAVYRDGTRKVATGVWRFTSDGYINLPSVYYPGEGNSDATLENEDFPTERIFGRLMIVLNEDEGMYYEKVKSY
jgi:hypothetical protein